MVALSKTLKCIHLKLLPRRHRLLCHLIVEVGQRVSLESFGDFLVEFDDPAGKVTLRRVLNLCGHLKTLSFESDKLATEAKPSATLRLEPLRFVGSTSLLALNRVSVLTLLIVLTNFARAVG